MKVGNTPYLEKTRNMSNHKDYHAMNLIYECPESFWMCRESRVYDIWLFHNLCV